MWFQNRRAKWRKKENTKKGPGRPAHNSHPQTCSGDPIPEDELRKKEQERLEKKKRKQEERMRRLEAKKRMAGLVGKDGKTQDCLLSPSLSSIADSGEAEIDVVGEGSGDRLQDFNDQPAMDKSSLSLPEREATHSPCSDMYATDSDSPSPKPALRSPFSIDSLLETPKVPRGRRPNSKYPRVQASKSMNPLSLGIMPLFPITQPVGFQVERLPTPPVISSTTIHDVHRSPDSPHTLSGMEHQHRLEPENPVSPESRLRSDEPCPTSTDIPCHGLSREADLFDPRTSESETMAPCESPVPTSISPVNRVSETSGTADDGIQSGSAS